MSAQTDAWTGRARAWDRYESPYRPHRDDTAAVEREAAALAARHGRLDAIMLGVTPQTAACAWPPGTALAAFDSSRAMIDRLWPAPGTPEGATAACADWRELPVATRSADLVAADGSLICLSYPRGFSEVIEEVRRVLRPDGRFVVRTFLRPDPPESLGTILADLDEGRISGAFALKMRVAATLHRPRVGISRAGLREFWLSLFPDQEAGARKFGWSFASFTMPHRDESDVFLYYPTLQELRDVLASAFDEREISVGGYELAERCPTLVLQPRPMANA